MRKKIVAGNWKMNTDLLGGSELFKKINNHCKDLDPRNLSVIVAPPFTHLVELSKSENRCIDLAAQNCSDEPHGAFTGEVSCAMICSTGAKYVIIGHSERRECFGESNGDLKKKIDLSLEAGLLPIYCCGESLEERKQGTYFDRISKQIEEALFHLSNTQIGKVIVAYEPIWAIGTGETASPQQAQEMHAFIRSRFQAKYQGELANALPIIYGGSCNSQNSTELFGMQDVDGGLIGGASLKAQDFIDIIDALINS